MSVLPTVELLALFCPPTTISFSASPTVIVLRAVFVKGAIYLLFVPYGKHLYFEVEKSFFGRDDAVREHSLRAENTKTFLTAVCCAWFCFPMYLIVFRSAP